MFFYGAYVHPRAHFTLSLGNYSTNVKFNLINFWNIPYGDTVVHARENPMACCRGCLDRGGKGNPFKRKAETGLCSVSFSGPFPIWLSGVKMTFSLYSRLNRAPLPAIKGLWI
jgi:hypothetical protein